jgi:sterol desaturase/sphingolipid hydroxylase (fatty acid hydroxylase superfamily)
MDAQVKLMNDLAELAGILPLLLLPLEFWRLHKAKALGKRTWLEVLANLSPLIPVIVTTGMVAAFVVWLFTSVSAVSIATLPINIWTILGAIILVDFMYYWDHRFGHRIRLLWAVSHSVHHSSPLFNQTTALRISFVDGFISPWYYTPIIFLGFDPFLVAGAFGVVLAYQQWIHTETIGKLGWFDVIFNSPSNHRVHHATQEQYLDKNYGGIFMVWDHIFSTYEPEGEAVSYGLVHQIDSTNPIMVHCAEAIRFVKKFATLKTPKQRFDYTFRDPSFDVEAPQVQRANGS